MWINASVYIVWYLIEFSRLLSYTVSSPLWRIQHISAANAIHNSPFFVPPGTHYCWVDRGGMIWEACPTSLHMAGSVTRAPVTHPSTNWAQRCLKPMAGKLGLSPIKCIGCSNNTSANSGLWIFGVNFSDLTGNGYHTVMCCHLLTASNYGLLVQEVEAPCLVASEYVDINAECIIATLWQSCKYFECYINPIISTYDECYINTRWWMLYQSLISICNECFINPIIPIHKCYISPIIPICVEWHINPIISICDEWHINPIISICDECYISSIT